MIRPQPGGQTVIMSRPFVVLLCNIKLASGNKCKCLLTTTLAQPLCSEMKPRGICSRHIQINFQVTGELFCRKVDLEAEQTSISSSAGKLECVAKNRNV